MCIICKEYQLGKLTLFEAKRNFLEMGATLDFEHQKEVVKLLSKKALKKEPDDSD